MMYPFMKLEDNTEIVHSQMLPDGRVKVYIEKPVEGGFQSAACYLPKYQWQDIDGFSEAEIGKLQEMLESVAHLIIRSSQEGNSDLPADL